ncbi:response regulator [Octadecabacter sp. G9-8]|uniref:Response regulator n=1 Tax=Octadecabacter dasysiphoniae TaxID=2909341 RepID=A0ABS9CWG2_9RHOB|nr:response regulator [Octadecabacter dasysiphoniae]MCF2870496.1 response regulator [Octadecabacter dasysiphoniae]
MLKVLVLEDDPALRFALTQVLEDCGHLAYAASDIPAACEILNQVTPDLLLLDLMIGPVDSIQVADLAGYRIPDAEIIYLTGSNKYPNGELFELSKNASWVLRKPIDFNELKAMLAHVESSLSKSSSPRTMAMSAAL